jgi:hypothetical protein
MELINILFKTLFGVQFTLENIAFVLGGALFATFSFLLTRAIYIQKGIATNKISPEQFSWKYFWSKPENKLSVFISISAIIAGLRFSQEFFPNAEQNMYRAFVIGASVDVVILLIENISKQVQKIVKD